eukprot:2141853-Pleurochrysis_carterae.AAC.1
MLLQAKLTTIDLAALMVSLQMIPSRLNQQRAKHEPLKHNNYLTQWSHRCRKMKKVHNEPDGSL